MKNNVLVITSLLCISAIAVACGPRKQAVNPQGQSSTASSDNSASNLNDSSNVPSASSSTQSDPTDTQSSLQISDEIIKACGISAPEAFFGFDSAKVKQDDIPALTKVAACFSTGPLKGRQLKLVGHADPRGSADYNTVLGQSRADSVAKYLSGKGLNQSQISTTSRGASEAKGSDETSWAKDRRVELLLGR